jgi:hypothetical protein
MIRQDWAILLTVAATVAWFYYLGFMRGPSDAAIVERRMRIWGTFACALIAVAILWINWTGPRMWAQANRTAYMIAATPFAIAFLAFLFVPGFSKALAKRVR